MHKPLLSVLPALACTALATAQARWSLQYPPSSPPARASAVMAYHAGSDALLLFSGFGAAPVGSTNLQDCWLFDGVAWSQVGGALPPARARSALAQDRARGVLVLFGGWLPGTTYSDTWEWNGTTWSQRVTAVAPQARSQHAMAYDEARGVTVLFGGSAQSSNQYLDDTWEWDGATWTDVSPASGPGGLSGASMAFDPVNQTMLLWGGRRQIGGAVAYSNETWAWDGASWTQRTPSTPPGVRTAQGLVCDLDRGRVILHGGDTGDPFTWEWDGQQWAIRLEATPGIRSSPAIAYDEAGRRTVLFGGQIGNVFLGDTWSFATDAPADVSAFGAGCAGSAGVPVLGGKPGSLPWLGDAHRNVVTNVAPGELGALFVASFGPIAPIDLTPVGMPGCDLLVGLDVLEFGVAVGGEAEWEVQVPNDPAVAGVSFYQQAFPLDGAASPLGFSASNGVVVTTGIR